MKILITGGLGFIGWNLRAALKEDGHDVWTLDKSDYREYENLKVLEPSDLHGARGQGHPAVGNILYREYLEGMFSDVAREGHPFEAVIHLAAVPGVRIALEEIADQAATNIGGFSNLLVALGRHHKDQLKHFIYATSSSAYDESGNVPPNTINGRTVYGLSKAANVAIVERYATTWLPKTNFTGLRIHNAIGPFCRGELAPVKWTHDMVSGKTINLFCRPGVALGGSTLPNPEHFLYRDFTPISSIIAAVRGTLDSKNVGIHRVEKNLGHGDPVSILTMLRIMEDISGWRAMINVVPAPMTEAIRTFSGERPLTISGEARFAIEYGRLYRWLQTNNYLNRDTRGVPLV